jgi:response regulator RpfG family c-di-GMP phosphodiesterase
VCGVQYGMPCGGRAHWKYGTRVLPRRYSLRVEVNLCRYHQEKQVIPGDVVVYNLKGQAIPIVHRVLTVQDRYF